MNKQTILSAYFKARERHVLSVFFSETASQEDLNSGFAEYFLRVKRQVETFAARLAVVQPTKRNALSDDTPLSVEAMKAFGATPVTFAGWNLLRIALTDSTMQTNLSFYFDANEESCPASIGMTLMRWYTPNIKTVGDLKTLYRMLTDRELEEVK